MEPRAFTGAVPGFTRLQHVVATSAVALPARIHPGFTPGVFCAKADKALNKKEIYVFSVF
jgi:hypothetical protein